MKYQVILICYLAFLLILLNSAPEMKMKTLQNIYYIPHPSLQVQEKFDKFLRKSDPNLFSVVRSFIHSYIHPVNIY